MIGHASLNLLKANLGRFSGGGRVGEPGQAQNCAGAFQGSACFTTVDIPLAKRGPWPTQSHSGLPAKVHDKGRRVHQTTIKLAGEGEVRANKVSYLRGTKSRCVRAPWPYWGGSVPETHRPIFCPLPLFQRSSGAWALPRSFPCLLGLARGPPHGASVDSLCLRVSEIENGRVSSTFPKDSQDAFFSGAQRPVRTTTIHLSS